MRSERQRWVRVEAEGHDVALVNDAKYSYAAENGTLYITDSYNDRILKIGP